MAIPYCLDVSVDMVECFNGLCTVVIVFVRGRVEGSLDVDLLVTPGLKACAYSEFLNVAILKVVVGTSLT